jgi:glycosyltransferase involved in cell wall biosynthesis
MNILHISTFLQGGAGRIIYNLALQQKNDGHRVVVITSKTEESGYENYSEYIDGLIENDIPVYKIDSSFKRNLYLNLLVVEQAREIILENDIDIIHAHAAIPALIGMIARQISIKYIPVIQTMHGYGFNKNYEQEQMDKIIMNGLDRVIPVSFDSRDLLESKGISSDKMEVIYNGIFENQDSTIADEDLDLKELQKLKNNGRTIIGCIGSVGNTKNQELLVDAIQLLKKKYPFLVYYFVGEGDKIKELREKTKSYVLEDQIKFVGYKRNANEYLKNFELLVLPSKSEGFGLVIIEGFRQKVPVLSSDIKVFKELIKDNVNGFLFKNEDKEDLALKIGQIIKMPDEKKAEIIEEAYHDYKTNFIFEVMYHRYMELYKKLIFVTEKDE